MITLLFAIALGASNESRVPCWRPNTKVMQIEYNAGNIVTKVEAGMFTTVGVDVFSPANDYNGQRINRREYKQKIAGATSYKFPDQPVRASDICPAAAACVPNKKSFEKHISENLEKLYSSFEPYVTALEQKYTDEMQKWCNQYQSGYEFDADLLLQACPDSLMDAYADNNAKGVTEHPELRLKWKAREELFKQEIQKAFFQAGGTCIKPEESMMIDPDTCEVSFLTETTAKTDHMTVLIGTTIALILFIMTAAFAFAVFSIVKAVLANRRDNAMA